MTPPRLPFALRFALELTLVAFVALLGSLAWVAQTLEARDGVGPTMLALGVAVALVFAVCAMMDAHRVRVRIDRVRAIGGIIVWRRGRVVEIIGGGQ